MVALQLLQHCDFDYKTDYGDEGVDFCMSFGPSLVIEQVYRTLSVAETMFYDDDKVVDAVMYMW